MDFNWPEHIKFDDTEVDLNAARRVWLDVHGEKHSGRIKDLFEFMHTYVDEVEKRRKNENADLIQPLSS